MTSSASPMDRAVAVCDARQEACVAGGEVGGQDVLAAGISTPVGPIFSSRSFACDLHTAVCASVRRPAGTTCCSSTRHSMCHMASSAMPPRQSDESSTQMPLMWMLP